MANRPFRKDAHKRMTTGSFNYATADLRALLVDTGVYDPDTAISGDEHLEDIAEGARVSYSAALQNVTVVDGVLDADDLAVPDTGGQTAEEVVILEHTGDEATSRLGLLIDTATGLPISRDSVPDLIQWHASGIAAI